jgi:NIPSNAP
MITLCIRYAIDPNKYRNFEDYARTWPEPIRRCGGELIGYFLPTKLAGPTNLALALIDFPNLEAYEKYRAALTKDPAAAANVALIEKSGCILSEDRAFVQRIP